MSCSACPGIASPLEAQTELWDIEEFLEPAAELPNLLDYDQVIVYFSGGTSCGSL